MVKPSNTRLKQLFAAPLHRRSKNLGATLSPDLRSKYGKRGIRVRKGDTVKILRGEYKGIEGKVNRVHTETGRIEIEGVQREKTKGGNAPVLIHSSKVMIVGLDTEDKWRRSRLERGE